MSTTIDSQVVSYMQGWLRGVDQYSVPPQTQYEDYQRGYAAGRAAYEAAEQAERARLESSGGCARLCPHCGLKYGHDIAIGGTACHGTGRGA